MDNEIQKICEMLMSDDYKERFKGEYYLVKDKYDKLKTMCEKWDNGDLDFTPTCPRDIYDNQLDAMYNYMKILETRADIEGVVL